VTIIHGQIPLDGLARGGDDACRASNHARPQTKGKQMNELEEAIAEVRRERTIRASVYPRLVMVGKLTQAEADRRLAHLGWAHAFLTKLQRNWDLVCKLDGAGFDELDHRHDWTGDYTMGKESVHPVSVLRGVSNANNSATPTPAHASVEESKSVTRALAVNNNALVHIKEELHNLFTGCSPLDNRAISEYLTNPSDGDRMMLEAWARCGRNDRKRTVDLRLTEVARKTMTPLGLACLISYARAWIDETESRDAELRAQVRCLGLPVDDASRRRNRGRKQRPRGPASAKRTK
jgi:hypothetical protein